MLMSLVLLVAGAEAPPLKPDGEKVIARARGVVAAIVLAGKENGKRARAVRGDELTELYVRVAARAVEDVPERERAQALALGLGVAIDRSSLMRFNPVVGLTWRKVETNAERMARLAVLGEPTMHGRHDLAQHFFVSAGLTAVLGVKAAESAGLTKEILDAQEGGSGFSFADLAADYAGVRLAAQLIKRPGQVAEITRRFKVADFSLPPKGLIEGLTAKEFEKRYGDVKDPRFTKEQESIRKRIEGLLGYKGNP